MPGLSIHVVDVARGVVAHGMRVEVFRATPSRALVCAGQINERGVLDDAALNVRFEPGHFEALFHVAEFYRRAGIALPATPFLEVVTYRFGVDDPAQHYHLPFKVTPWGYSCFRGGA
jgi:5-hydroxyisourate hydrolase